MPLLLKVSWLIPFSPLLVSFLISILLITFNRTMNRLGRPISYLVITSIGLSTTLSFLLYNNHLSGEVFDWYLYLFSSELHLGVYVDEIAMLTSMIFGLLGLIIMISFFYFTDRQKGYISSFLSLGFVWGLIFSFILSGDLFHILV